MVLEKIKNLFPNDNNNTEIRVSEITRFKIFEDLTVSEASVIEKKMYRRFYKPGELIVKEDDAAIVIYFIIDGEAKVRKNVDHRQVELATLKSGSFFGEISILGDQKRSATIISAKKTEVLCLFEPDFENILLNHPVISEKVLSKFTQEMAERIIRMKKEINRFEGNGD